MCFQSNTLMSGDGSRNNDDCGSTTTRRSSTFRYESHGIPAIESAMSCTHALYAVTPNAEWSFTGTPDDVVAASQFDGTVYPVPINADGPCVSADPKSRCWNARRRKLTGYASAGRAPTRRGPAPHQQPSTPGTRAPG